MLKHTIISLGLLAQFASPAAAQSLSPMSQEIPSFADKFVFQVEIKNTYKTGQISNIRLFTPEWEPINNAFVSHEKAYLGSGQKLTITALVPFDNETTRQVYLCHSILPKINSKGAAFRGEVCGKYTAIRLA